MKRFLFVCVHNSGRSQMAEALCNHLSGGMATAESAGTEPGERINPNAVDVMAELGIDIAGAKPKLITQEMVDLADRVITMGCAVEESCPALFLPNVEDWALEDPAGKPLAKVREIRDEIAARVKALLDEG